MKKINIFSVTALTIIACFMTSSALGEVTAQLTKAPNVPSPLNRKDAETVVLKLEAKEFVGYIADGK